MPEIVKSFEFKRKASPIQNETNGECIVIPPKAANIIARIDAEATIEIQTTDKGIVFSSPGIQIYSRLVEGRYPKWREYIPNGSGLAARCLAGPFLSAVSQNSIVLNEERRGLLLSFKSGLLTISAKSTIGNSETTLPVEIESEGSTGLDGRSLSEMLRLLPPEQILSMKAPDAEAPVVFRTDDGFLEIIPPCYAK